MNRTEATIIGLIFFLSSTSILAQEMSEVPVPSVGGNDKFVSVEAEGQGTTKLEALNAAWGEAVRQGIGLYLDSKTEVVDEDIREQIVAHSRGRVNSYQELSAEKIDGIWRVVILAEIEKDILIETAAAAASTSVKVAGNQLAAVMATENQKKQSTKDLIAAFGDRFKTEDLFSLTLNPDIKDGVLVLNVVFAINKKAYNNIFLNDFVKLLDQLAIKKEEHYYKKSTAECNKFFESMHTDDPKVWHAAGVNPQVRGHAYNEGNYPPMNSIRIAVDATKYLDFDIDSAVIKEIYDIFRLKSIRLRCQFLFQAYAGNELLDTETSKITFFYLLTTGYSGTGGSARIEITPRMRLFIDNRELLSHYNYDYHVNQINFSIPFSHLSSNDLAAITEFKGSFSVSPQ